MIESLNSDHGARGCFSVGCWSRARLSCIELRFKWEMIHQKYNEVVEGWAGKDQAVDPINHSSHPRQQ